MHVRSQKRAPGWRALSTTLWEPEEQLIFGPYSHITGLVPARAQREGGGAHFEGPS